MYAFEIASNLACKLNNEGKDSAKIIKKLYDELDEGEFVFYESKNVVYMAFADGFGPIVKLVNCGQ